MSASTSTFDVAENARLALEAKDAQLRRMAARVAALEAERDAEAVSAVEADARAFVECVCVANAAMALVARDVAKRRGMDGTRAFAKTLVVGFVGVVDACFGGADARERRARDATTREGGEDVGESSRRAM